MPDITTDRSSGILLHPTSFPGPFGIGDLGQTAYQFADFLAVSGQSLWQVLPLGPTGYGDSPYACYSAFAGNTLLISPERLVAENLVTADEVTPLIAASDERIDFVRVHEHKEGILRRAFSRFTTSSRSQLKTDFEKFCSEERDWLDDYGLFRALKEANADRPWNEWHPSLVKRSADAIKQARTTFEHRIEAHKFAQFLFFRQWFELKSYCNKLGIKLIGDIPIFVAQDSSDVWTNPDQFKLDEDGTPTVVAGVPPDYFSTTGQLWGNPIYNWDQMLADGFKWWIKRIRASLQLFDVVRIDHFRGFAACWEIPAGDKTAERGAWVEAPGQELFLAVKSALGEIDVIAEDLGVITPDVESLRDGFGFPGMRVLQFSFGGNPKNSDLPHNYIQNSVAYTGTHDNDTTVGWFTDSGKTGSTRTAEEIKRERQFCLRYLNSNGAEINWDFIRALMQSVSNRVVIPLQDVLGLGSGARMNLPNSTEGNWLWRFKTGAINESLSRRLREMTETYGRLPPQP